MKEKTFIVIFALLLLCQGTGVHARQPYHATITVDTVSATVSAPNLVDLKRDLSSKSIEELIPLYTPALPVSLDFNLRGILALASFPANSTTLIVQIPQAGITQTFTGATRDDSITLFKDYLRDGGTKHKLLKAYAKFSPIDPIAGNPNSLMAKMAQADYLISNLAPASGCDSCWSAQPIVHQFQAGSDIGRAFSKGFDTTTVTIPLRYSYSPNLNWAFILDAPLTYNRNGGASSLFGSMGFGLRLPITHEWSVTPVLRGGGGGSADLCTGGAFLSTGLTSIYNYKICEYVASMTNYAGYFTSTNFWISGVNCNYHLHNYIFKNGLSFTSCKGFTVCNRPVNFKIWAEDSRFTREDLFMHYYDEVGISLIANYVNPYIDYDCLSIGLSYQFGQKSYKGWYLNAEYQF